MDVRIVTIACGKGETAKTTTAFGERRCAGGHDRGPLWGAGAAAF